MENQQNKPEVTVEEKDPLAAVKTVFDNVVIMDNISSHLSWKMLCECREVSRQFKIGCTPTWLKKAPAIILDFENSGKLDLLNQHSILPATNEETDFINYNYRNFNIKRFEIGPGWIIQFPFLNSQGDFIRNLEIHSCRFLQAETFFQLVFCKFTKNLESLKLTKCEFTWFNNKPTEEIEAAMQHAAETESLGSVKSLKSFGVEFPFDPTPVNFPWKIILKKYPSLESLRMCCYARVQLERLVGAIEHIRKADSKSLPLKHINVADHGVRDWIWFPEPLLEYLKKTGESSFNLKSLCFGINRTTTNRRITTNAESVLSLLSAVSHSLSYLQISHGFGGKARSLHLPPMANLTILKLYKFKLKNLNFLQQTSNLKALYVLEMRDFGHSINVLKTSDIWSINLPSMQTFACDAVVHYTDREFFILRKAMPNLVNFKMHLNDTSFRSLILHYPKLKSIHVCNSKISDSGFTGIHDVLNYKSRQDEDDEDTSSYTEEDDNNDDQMSTISFDYSVHSSEPDESDPDDFDSDVEEGEEEEVEEEALAEEEDEVEDEDDDLIHISDDNDEDLEDEVDEEEDDELDEEEDDELDEEEEDEVDEEETEEDDDDAERNRSVGSASSLPQRVEKYYRQEVKPMLFEYHNKLECYHSCKRLKDLEVLVLERCRRSNGIALPVSTVSIRNAFNHYLPSLKELWIEDGVMTQSGLWSALGYSWYRRYHSKNPDRPLFAD